MKTILNFFRRNETEARKPHYSILYRIHYLSCGVNSPAYYTGAVK